MRFLLLAVLCLFAVPAKAATYAVPNNGILYVYGDFASHGGSIGATFGYQTIGGSFSHYYGAFDPTTLEQITVRIDINQTGSVFTNSCNQVEAHCGRVDRVNTSFGIWGPEDAGVIGINTSVTATGGATAPEVLIYVSLWDGFTLETAPRIAAVPEPSTWAMMLLGFAGISFMAYRRRQTNTPEQRPSVATLGFHRCHPI